MDYLDALNKQRPVKRSPDMMDFEHRFLPDGCYLLLWLHTARVRAGQEDRAEMAEFVRKLVEPIRNQMIRADAL